MKYEEQMEGGCEEDRVFILKDGRAVLLEAPEEGEDADDGDA